MFQRCSSHLCQSQKPATKKKKRKRQQEKVKKSHPALRARACDVLLFPDVILIRVLAKPFTFAMWHINLPSAKCGADSHQHGTRYGCLVWAKSTRSRNPKFRRTRTQSSVILLVIPMRTKTNARPTIERRRDGHGRSGS